MNKTLLLNIQQLIPHRALCTQIPRRYLFDSLCVLHTQEKVCLFLPEGTITIFFLIKIFPVYQKPIPKKLAKINHSVGYKFFLSTVVNEVRVGDTGYSFQKPDCERKTRGWKPEKHTELGMDFFKQDGSNFTVRVWLEGGQLRGRDSEYTEEK